VAVADTVQYLVFWLLIPDRYFGFWTKFPVHRGDWGAVLLALGRFIGLGFRLAGGRTFSCFAKKK
jgi:hypothetical protein